MTTMHVDVGAILKATLNGVYSDLVTRSTGRTVRSGIEERMADVRPGTVAVIDFSHIGLIDFSCADEIVATLMRKCCADEDPSETYLLFSGITDAHLDAIEHVVERQRLALVVQFSAMGPHRLVGMVDESERLVWEAVVVRGRAEPATVALDVGLDEAAAAECLATLHRRRLLMREGAAYRAPFGAVA